MEVFYVSLDPMAKPTQVCIMLHTRKKTAKYYNAQSFLAGNADMCSTTDVSLCYEFGRCV